MKKELEDLGFEITMHEVKTYGEYFTGVMKYKYYFKLEISVSAVKGNKNIYIRLSENHYRGNVNGYVSKISDVKPIIDFMTRDRND